MDVHISAGVQISRGAWGMQSSDLLCNKNTVDSKGRGKAVCWTSMERKMETVKRQIRKGWWREQVTSNNEIILSKSDWKETQKEEEANS